MENPLEVLSRAASMVETNDANRDAALKRTLEVDPSVLPPKYKYRHMNPQQADTFGLEPAETSHNRRCTGTQTSFSSFPHDMYPTQRPPDYKLLDLDRVTPPTASPPILDHHHHHGPARHHRIPAMLSAYPGRPSPPTGATHQASPTGATHSVSPTPSSPTEDANATPLNLTTASQHHKHMAQNCSDAGVNAQSHHQRRQQQQSQHRPSVIRQSPYSPGGGGSSGRGSPPRRASPKHGTITPDTDVRLFILPSDPCGTSIDEHFRRSLGGKYPPAVYGVTAPGSPLTASCSSSSPTRSGSPPSPTPAPPAYQLPPEMPAGETTKSNVSIAAGTVDDHFARALGDKWKEINPRPNPPSPPPRQQPAKQLSPPPPKQPSPPPVQLDILAGSVDDHFAKALGDTWLRIKAEKERSEGSNPGSPV